MATQKNSPCFWAQDFLPSTFSSYFIAQWFFISSEKKVETRSTCIKYKIYIIERLLVKYGDRKIVKVERYYGFG